MSNTTTVTNQPTAAEMKAAKAAAAKKAKADKAAEMKAAKGSTDKAAAGKTDKAATTAPKVKKANPIKDARRDMLKSIGDNRKSLNQCLAEVVQYGADWLTLNGLDVKKVAKFRPTDLEPHQTESEAFRYVANNVGELVKERKGWTPSRVASAIERMIKAAKIAPPKDAL